MSANAQSVINIISGGGLMEIVSMKQGNATLVRLKGRMDVATAGDVERACERVIQGGEKFVVLDLGGLDYISSAGLRGILGVDKKIKAQGGKLALCNLKGMVKEVFQISGFAVMFSIFDTAEAALDQTC